MSDTIEQSGTVNVGNEEPVSQSRYSSYTYLLSVVVVGLVLYLFYYSYQCFQSNSDDMISESFIEKTVKTGPGSDRSFDMNEEVDRLRKLQEDYLASLKKL